MVMIIMQSVAKLTQAVFAQSVLAQYNACKLVKCTRLGAVAVLGQVHTWRWATAWMQLTVEKQVQAETAAKKQWVHSAAIQTPASWLD